MTDSPFFSAEAEIAYFVPETELRFLSFGIWSPRLRRWVPMLFTDKRELVAGQAARAVDGGFQYWIICFATDDESAEVAAWRSIPSPDSDEFLKMVGDGLHSAMH